MPRSLLRSGQAKGGVFTWTLQPTPIATERVDVAGTGDAYAAILTIYIARSDARIVLVAYELTWSPLTAGFKDSRFTPDSAVNRSLFNQKIKAGVFADGMSEAVLYVGNYHDDILGRSVGAALRRFYEAKFDPAEIRPTENGPWHPVVLLSESLGSIMLFDALEQEAAYAQSKEKWQRDAFARMMASTRVVYMMANQLPLLDVDRQTTEGSPVRSLQTPSRSRTPTDRLKALSERRSDAVGKSPLQTAAAPGPIELVVFSDPSDLLSYQLYPKDVADLPNLRMHDFTPRNTFNWFGLFEWPATAHTGYAQNAEVADIVVHGYRK